MNTKSEQAQVAAIIRKELRKNGIVAKVTSKSYSMGDSVNVNLTDLAPWAVTAIQDFCAPYQQGHFNGMEDIYEYSNSRNDIPQTKFLMINNSFSDDVVQAAWTELRERLSGFEGSPELYQDAHSFYNENAREMAFVLVTRYLRSSDFGYFQKPRIAA